MYVKLLSHKRKDAWICSEKVNGRKMLNICKSWVVNRRWTKHSHFPS